MSKSIVKLNALNIEVDVPKKLKIHNEGYIQTLEFYERFSKASMNRGLTLREAMSLSDEFGAYESYLSKDGKEIRHVHYYVSDQIQDKFPLNLYVSAHEETEILVRKGLIYRPDIFVKRLNSIGIITRELPDVENEFHKIGHIGGLACLISKGTKIENNSDEIWKSFIIQCGDMQLDPDFKKALSWVKERIR